MIFFEIPIVYILVVIAIILALVFVGFVGLVFWIQAHLTAIITVIGIINVIFIILGIIFGIMMKSNPQDEDGTKDSFIGCFFFGAFLGLIASVILDLPLYLIYRILMFIASLFGIV